MAIGSPEKCPFFGNEKKTISLILLLTTYQALSEICGKKLTKQPVWTNQKFSIYQNLFIEIDDY